MTRHDAHVSAFRERRAEERNRQNDALAKTPGQIIGEDIARGLFGSGWRLRAEIIDGYVAPYAKQDARPAVEVRYKAHGRKHASFLRYSLGPQQGWFWDVYGESLHSVGLALRAIMEAYRPGGVGCETTDFDSGEHREEYEATAAEFGDHPAKGYCQGCGCFPGSCGRLDRWHAHHFNKHPRNEKAKP